jgi:hypothetical protein
MSPMGPMSVILPRDIGDIGNKGPPRDIGSASLPRCRRDIGRRKL